MDMLVTKSDAIHAMYYVQNLTKYVYLYTSPLIKIDFLINNADSDNLELNWIRAKSSFHQSDC